MNLYKELQDKLTEHDPTEVDQLILDDVLGKFTTFSESNKKDLEKYTNLVHLSLNGKGIQSLKNFPKLENLQVLELRGNELNGSDFSEINKLYPNLYKLKVGENPLTNNAVFKVFKDGSLRKLELEGTEISEKDEYREKLFELCENLEIIDNETREGDHATTTNYEDDDEGEFDGEGEDNEDFEGEDEFDEYDDDDAGDDDDEDEE